MFRNLLYTTSLWIHLTPLLFCTLLPTIIQIKLLTKSSTLYYDILYYIANCRQTREIQILLQWNTYLLDLTSKHITYYFLKRSTISRIIEYYKGILVENCRVFIWWLIFAWRFTLLSALLHKFIRIWKLLYYWSFFQFFYPSVCGIFYVSKQKYHA